MSYKLIALIVVASLSCSSQMAAAKGHSEARLGQDQDFDPLGQAIVNLHQTVVPGTSLFNQSAGVAVVGIGTMAVGIHLFSDSIGKAGLLPTLGFGMFGLGVLGMYLGGTTPAQPATMTEFYMRPENFDQFMGLSAQEMRSLSDMDPRFGEYIMFVSDQINAHLRAVDGR